MIPETNKNQDYKMWYFYTSIIHSVMLMLFVLFMYRPENGNSILIYIAIIGAVLVPFIGRQAAGGSHFARILLIISAVLFPLMVLVIQPNIVIGYMSFFLLFGYLKK